MKNLSRAALISLLTVMGMKTTSRCQETHLLSMTSRLPAIRSWPSQSTQPDSSVSHSNASGLQSSGGTQYQRASVDCRSATVQVHTSSWRESQSQVPGAVNKGSSVFSSGISLPLHHTPPSPYSLPRIASHHHGCCLGPLLPWAHLHQATLVPRLSPAPSMFPARVIAPIVPSLCPYTTVATLDSGPGDTDADKILHTDTTVASSLLGHPPLALLNLALAPASLKHLFH